MASAGPQRWNFTWVNCDCPDARFLYSLSRSYGWGDTRSTQPVPCDEKDASEWKRYFKSMTAQRPLLGLALAIDHNQEPAQRAMEANKWHLVATGERGHDRTAKSGAHVYARLYMKYFPKTGKLFPFSWYGGEGQPKIHSGALTANYTCSMGIQDYGVAPYKMYPEAVIKHSGYGDGQSLVVSRIPLELINKGIKLPESNFYKFAETSVANYYVSNPVEMFVGEGKKNG